MLLKTPSQQAKAAGLKSLTSVSDITGVSLQTLTNWHRDKPKLFAAVLAGCVALTIEQGGNMPELNQSQKRVE